MKPHRCHILGTAFAFLCDCDHKHQGDSIWSHCLTRVWIAIINIRRPDGRLICIMQILIPEKKMVLILKRVLELLYMGGGSTATDRHYGSGKEEKNITPHRINIGNNGRGGVMRQRWWIFNLILADFFWEFELYFITLFTVTPFNNIKVM